MNKFLRKILFLVIIFLSISYLVGVTSNSDEYPQFIDTNSLQQYITYSLNQRTKSIEIIYKGHDIINKEVLDSIFQKTMEDMYLKNSIDSWSYSADGVKGRLKIHINVIYRTTLDEEIALDNAISKILADIITNNMTDFEKIKVIHDYIVLNSKYSLETNSSPYSPYTLITEGKGVCAAYALLAYKMLTKCNIETYIVEGETTEAHAWNIVKLDNAYYNLDTTWDDPLEDRKGLVQYTYFLVSDEYLSKDHTWDKTAYPNATSTVYQWLHSIKEAYTKGNTIHYINDYGERKQITYTINDTRVSNNYTPNKEPKEEYIYKKPKRTIKSIIDDGIVVIIDKLNNLIIK